jgi:hypothetical protein
MSTAASFAIARSAHLNNARLGVVHFVSRLQVDTAEDAMGDLHTRVAALVQGKVLKQAVDLATRVPEVEKHLNSITETVKRWLADRFGASPEDVQLVVSFLKKELPGVIDNIKEAVAREAGGTLTLGLPEIGYKLYTAVDQAITYYNLNEMSKSAKLESGHPALVADAITRHVLRSSLVGLAEAAKKAALLVLAGVSAGASLIVEKIADVIEALLRFAVRLCESLMLSRLFRSAKQHWLQKDQPDSIHANPEGFQEWFKPAIGKTPIVASLVMNCGVAGDAMAFLQVCTDGGEGAGAPISQGEFDSGVAYLNKLKASAAAFIRDYQKNIKIVSDYDVYKALLKHAGEIDLIQKEASSGWRSQLFQFANSGSKKGKVAGWALRKLGQQSTVHTIAAPKKK